MPTDAESKAIRRRKMRGEVVELPACKFCGRAAVVRGSCLKCSRSQTDRTPVDRAR